MLLEFHFFHFNGDPVINFSLFLGFYTASFFFLFTTPPSNQYHLTSRPRSSPRNRLLPFIVIALVSLHQVFFYFIFSFSRVSLVKSSTIPKSSHLKSALNPYSLHKTHLLLQPRLVLLLPLQLHSLLYEPALTQQVAFINFYSF